MENIQEMMAGIRGVVQHHLSAESEKVKSTMDILNTLPLVTELRRELENVKNINRRLEERLRKYEEKENIELEILELEKNKSLEKRIIPDFFSINEKEDEESHSSELDFDVDNDHYALDPIEHSDMSILGVVDNEKLSLNDNDDDDDDDDNDDDDDDDADDDDDDGPEDGTDNEEDEGDVPEEAANTPNSAMEGEEDVKEFYAEIEGAPSLKVVSVMINGKKHFTNGKTDGSIFEVVHMTGGPGRKIGYFEDGKAFFS